MFTHTHTNRALSPLAGNNSLPQQTHTVSEREAFLSAMEMRDKFLNSPTIRPSLSQLPLPLMSSLSATPRVVIYNDNENVDRFASAIDWSTPGSSKALQGFFFDPAKATRMPLGWNSSSPVRSVSMVNNESNGSFICPPVLESGDVSGSMRPTVELSTMEEDIIDSSFNGGEEEGLQGRGNMENHFFRESMFTYTPIADRMTEISRMVPYSCHLDTETYDHHVGRLTAPEQSAPVEFAHSVSRDFSTQVSECTETSTSYATEYNNERKVSVEELFSSARPWRSMTHVEESIERLLKDEDVEEDDTNRHTRPSTEMSPHLVGGQEAAIILKKAEVETKQCNGQTRTMRPCEKKHPNNCKPCPYFCFSLTQPCLKGEDCRFCHLEHYSRRLQKRLEKQKKMNRPTI